MSRQGALMDDVIVGLISLARLRAYQGKTDEAFETIREMNSIIRGFGVERMTMLASAYVARVQMTTDQKQAAVQWAAVYQSARGEQPHEFEELTLARISADDR